MGISRALPDPWVLESSFGQLLLNHNQFGNIADFVDLWFWYFVRFMVMAVIMSMSTHFVSLLFGMLRMNLFY